MSDLSLRPRKSTELVDAAFQVYRREPIAFILTAAIVYVPLFVLMAGAGVIATIDSTLGSLIVIVAGIAAGLLFVVGSGVVTLTARDVYLDRPVNVTAAFRTAASRAGTLFVAVITVGLLIGLFFLMLFFPALYMYARCFAVRQVILLEGADLGTGLSRSSMLSKDAKRHILNTIGLVGLLGFVVNLGLGFVAIMVGSELLQALMSIVFGVIIFPLFGITETLLYYDIRIRKEGFDIEMLTGGDVGAVLPTTTPAPQA